MKSNTGLEKKKVLMAVCNYFDPDNRVFRAADTLQEAGFELSLLAYYREGLKRKEVLASGFSLFRIEMKVLFKLSSKLSNLIKYRIFQRKAKQFARELKPDVVHCHDYNTLFLGVYCKRKFGSRIVYDNHEYFQDLNYIHRYPLFVRKRIAAYERKVLKTDVDQLVVVSPGIAQLYRQFYAGNINVVRNIPDLDLNKKEVHLPDEVLTFLEKQKQEKRKLLLYLGTNSQRGRGMDFAFDLLKTLPDDYGLLICGAKNQQELDYLNDKYHKLEHGTRFKAFKSLSHPELMLVADYCYMGLSLIEPIYLSYRYSLPNKLFEYLMMGLPVLSSNIPDQQELVEKYGIGVAIPFDLKQAGEMLVNYSVDHQKLEAAKLELSWNKEKQKYLELYSNLK